MTLHVPVPARVLRTHRETPDVVTLELDPGPNPPPFAPGQFNMLYAFGAGESAISLSGDPERPDRWVHTVRAVGNVTEHITGLEPNDWLAIRGPFGRPWPVDTARGRNLLLVAGGIGLAPLRPVIYSVLRRRPEFERVTLLYGARSPADMIYRAELDTWRDKIEVETTVDQSTQGWSGRVGVVTSLIDRLDLSGGRWVVMMCGPEIMMRFSMRALERSEISPRQVWVSMERNMKCGIGVCGHCQYGADFVCRDGPVFRFDRVAARFRTQEV